MQEDFRSKQFISVKELADIMSISKSYAYEFVSCDDCPFKVIRLGVKRLVIPTNSFYRWYDSFVEQKEDE